MQISISRLLVGVLALGATLVLITACKPKEAAPASTIPAPITNSPPAAAVAVTTTPPATNAPIVIAPIDARKHIGNTVTVRGLVADVKVTQKGDVFLNFGGKYPNVYFTAVCFQGAIPTAELTALRGKTISVTGKIKDYNGQVEIVLDSADQIGK